MTLKDQLRVIPDTTVITLNRWTIEETELIKRFSKKRTGYPPEITPYLNNAVVMADPTASGRVIIDICDI